MPAYVHMRSMGDMANCGAPAKQDQLVSEWTNVTCPWCKKGKLVGERI